MSINSYSDHELLQKIIEIASENAPKYERWPANLKPEAIQAEAEKSYSVWNSFITALSNVCHVMNRDGHTVTESVFNVSNGTTRLNRTYYVLDRLDSTPGPYRTDYRAFLNQRYNEVSKLQYNFKHNPYGEDPETYERMIKLFQDKMRKSEEQSHENIKKKSCCDLGHFYQNYIVKPVQLMNEAEERVKGSFWGRVGIGAFKWSVLLLLCKIESVASELLFT